MSPNGSCDNDTFLPALQLADVGRRLQEPQTDAAPDHHNLLREAQQVFRDDAVEYTRVCAWLDVSGLCLGTSPKLSAELHVELCMCEESGSADIDSNTTSISCCFLQVCLYQGWKPQAMFVVSTHLVRVLLAVSQRGALLQYAPEVSRAGCVMLIIFLSLYPVISIALPIQHHAALNCQLAGGTLSTHLSSA
jgi:hypothetical protein